MFDICFIRIWLDPWIWNLRVKRANLNLGFLAKQSNLSGNSPPAVRPKLRRIKALYLQIDQLLKSQRGFGFVLLSSCFIGWNGTPSLTLHGK